MKRALMVFWLVCSVTLLASATALAASEGNSGMTTGAQEMNASANSGGVFAHPQRLSTLLGLEVVNPSGTELGKVRDLIAGEDGRINYLVLARGGLMGIGANLVAIPMSAISPRITKDGKCNIDINAALLKKAPTFAADHYPDFANKGWQKQVRGYFSTQGSQPADQGMVPDAGQIMPKTNKSAPGTSEGSNY